MIKTPVIIVNVKTYAEATGENARELAVLMDEVSKETGISMVIAVQATDISLCAREVSIPVFAEHIDAITPGSHTGWILPEAVKEAGATGTLINHSEHRLKLADIESCISIAKKLGLSQVVCTNNVATSKAAAALEPEFVAIEPPELIGGDISVTTADPDIVRRSVEEVKKINDKVKVLCGAGVKLGKDIAKALELGADGVLLASGVVKAGDKRQVLMDLASGVE
ncbi:MAG TPA: triose-phosphate isomerase [Thermoplasmatales archaeon]|nr:triose-phosphate isomerase [Thermoplasmatales archaeon]